MSGHVPWGKARWLGGELGGAMASAVGGPAAVMTCAFALLGATMFLFCAVGAHIWTIFTSTARMFLEVSSQ